MPNVFTLIALPLLVYCYCSAFTDLDYLWQIRTGELLVQAGALRVPESFSYTLAGRMVPDFEWLYEVLLWGIWNQFGHGGLKLLKTMLVGGTLVLLGRRLQREGIAWHGIALALLVAVAALHPLWNLRPLFCTSLGLLILVGCLHDHCAGRRPLSLWLPLLMLLWANLHPGVILGQAILAGAIGWEWLNRRVCLNRPLEQTACVRLTAVGGLALAATFLSPDPIERLLYPFRPELAHPVMRAFTEMQPLYQFVAHPPYTAGLVYLVAALVLLTVVLRFRAYRLWELATLAGLTLLANVAIRSVQDWLLILLALGLPHYAVLLRQTAQARNRGNPAARTGWSWPVLDRLLELDWLSRHVLRRPLTRFQPFWVLLACGVLTALSLIPPVARRMPRQDSELWPVAALEAIEAQGLTGRFFSPPNFGSALGWRLRERGLCYVDTRGFFFPPELLEDSILLPQLVAGWEERLTRVLAHGTDWFLLETTGPRGRLWQEIRPHVGEPHFLDSQVVLLHAAQVRQGVDKLAHR